MPVNLSRRVASVIVGIAAFLVASETAWSEAGVSKAGGESSVVAFAPPTLLDRAPSRGGPAGYAEIAALIEQEAKRAGVPAEIAEAVTHTESRFNPRAIGADGEVGLMQVLPSTARMMGFSGSLVALADPAVNIRYGVTYLAQAWRRAGRDLCTAVMKYRAGHGETRFSHLSVDYCRKVRARLSARGYAVTGIVPTATFGNPAGHCRGRCLTGREGGANLTALNSKLNQIVIRVSVIKVPMR